MCFKFTFKQDDRRLEGTLVILIAKQHEEDVAYITSWAVMSYTQQTISTVLLIVLTIYQEIEYLAKWSNILKPIESNFKGLF